ncbi:Crp/Fnr family transcriptional regulator [Actinomadura rayongensis]|uniref:Cyclic nucleotide-binding domain-containing protein n=1 Tax=Actinomadura rayongensis TaxID=1429076 RepID=A0A6I4W9D5_9ACTN|nr:cyclic nucleotide-binding domain-containing protein [Actinomadura rayongensis]MXQ64885.1 cyclic nucleotide-binding domain-containing protein [Actinomadura rayongensis]
MVTSERPRRGVTPPPDDRAAEPTFWDALTDQERRELARLSDHVDLPADRVLWEEGALADHALVILRGSVRVWVERDGCRRTLAVRGAGSLIGERAELGRRTRSAGVVTLEQVRMLRVPTDLFAAFLSVHARLHGVLERQIYARLREATPEQFTRVRLTIQHPGGVALPDSGDDVHVATRPVPGLPAANRLGDECVASTGHGPTRPFALPDPVEDGEPTRPYPAPGDEWRLGDHYDPNTPSDTGPHAAPPVAPPAAVPSDDVVPGLTARYMVVETTAGPAAPDGGAAARAMVDPSGWAGRMCAILFTDVAGFSGPHRTDEDRYHVRHIMYDMLRAGFTAAGVPWEACYHEDRGDGAFIVVPVEIPPRALVSPLLPMLADALRRHNHRSSAAFAVQLRVAMNIGQIYPDTEGMSGLAIIRTARMLDAPVLKKQMAGTGADLGFITSEFVYDAILAESGGPFFQRVPVRVKESRMTAWMRLWGASTGAGDRV